MTHSPEYEADLVVDSVVKSADDVVVLTLVHPAGETLPEWAPGAHVELVLTDDLIRQYSLCSSPTDRHAYAVGVLRDAEGRGGSVFIHDQVKVGDTMHVRGPRNHFQFVASGHYLFIAGGIGVTPLIPMIEAADAAGADWQLVYGGRSRSAMAFLPELEQYGERVTFVPRDEVELSLSKRIDTLLGTPHPGTLVYCCGPEALLEAVEAACAHWPGGSLHLERFAPKPFGDDVDDVAFEVELQRSGKTITVPPGRSIFRVCEDNGVSVLGSCHEGICGTCETVIIEGEAEHRDSVLTDAEKASNETLMVCVSRAKGDRLVLDL